MNIKSVLSLFFIAFLVSFQAASAQFYSLPVGQGLVETISDNGIAAGSFNNSANQYFMWEVGVGGRINIGGVPAGNGVGGQAKISNDGAFICGTTFNTASGFHEASRYEIATATWTPLGGLGSSSGTETSSGWGISGDGQTVVGLAWISAGSAHAGHWNGGIVTDLGSTVAGQSTRANGVNFDGSVVVGWQDGNGRQGAVWQDGVQELIFDNGGNPAAEAQDVSEDGRFVVGFGFGDFVEPGIPYRYDVDTNTYLGLGPIPGGERNAVGTAVSADGTLVGGGTWPFATPASFGTGYIWHEGVGAQTVADYLTSAGASGWPANWNFNFVSAISSDGQWIAGWGGTGFAANQSWAVRLPQVLLGDVNMDGVVDLLDVAPFVAVLTSGKFQAEADINGDGVVDLLDVAPFVEILTSP